MLRVDDGATIKERPVMTNSDKAHVPEQPPTPGPEIRPMAANERIVRANGIDLCVQTFGDRADPPILLIMGGASSMDWWEEGFCERRSEEHTSELQSRQYLVCRLLLEKKNNSRQYIVFRLLL